MRAHVAEECKNDYAAQLQKFNKEQNQFYFIDMPLIFNVSESPVDARCVICALKIGEHAERIHGSLQHQCGAF